MKAGAKNNLLLLLLFYILHHCAGLSTNAQSYDYSASVQCLKKPLKAQYDGGIIVNGDSREGLQGWDVFGGAKIEHRVAKDNNNFIVVSARNQPFDSVSQKLNLEANLLYTFSAWIQISEGSEIVRAVFKTDSDYIVSGSVLAKSGCWSMLKGGLTVDASVPAQLYFETNNTAVEIWVDSVSLQPFTEKQWRQQQEESINEKRKQDFSLKIVDEQGKPLSNAEVTLKQERMEFPLGCAINKNILSNTAYQDWFKSKGFNVATFENELKWYSTEPSQGKVDYAVADSMLEYVNKLNISIRGHNVVWNDPTYQMEWIKSLSPADLRKVIEERVTSVMTKYKGKVIAWDVDNENLHFDFLEKKLGQNASAIIYDLASKADPTTTLFMNEFNTIEENRDGLSIPAKYLDKINQILSLNKDLKLGIGLEGHFGSSSLNLPYIRASIDFLAAKNLPVWITEVDVKSGPNQAQYLEEILREVYSHPKVEGIVIWGAWSPQGCYRMCLTDNNFKNLATGDVVDRLLLEWKGGSFTGTTDQNGLLKTPSLSHGDYIVEINSSPSSKTLKLTSKVDPNTPLLVQVKA